MKHLLLALLMLVMGFNSNAQVSSETYLMGEGDGMFDLAELQDLLEEQEELEENIEQVEEKEEEDE